MSFVAWWAAALFVDMGVAVLVALLRRSPSEIRAVTGPGIPAAVPGDARQLAADVKSP
ncbi:MAG: hypothetical protein QM713_04225 [Arachnia sp.]